ncbi:MAG: rhamnulokinase [Actinomycetota bacterium]|nr:rhamnulokinase [Actinomycetota bacterium]
MTWFAAVDLGASSGRVMLADVSPDRVRLEEVHRFVNPLIRQGSTLRWDIAAIWAGVQEGLRAAADLARTDGGQIIGIGVDAWAVDYALLSADGELLDNPRHYRDARTDGVPEQVDAVLSPAALYQRTGVQRMSINTVYQFVSARETEHMALAKHALLIPDLITYWLTGTLATELTNASTTGLLDVRERDWSSYVFAALGLRGDLFPPICGPGSRLGPVQPGLAAELGVASAQVTAVGSHDTASAVAGVPAADEHFVFISCGTWSLVGVEVTSPITSEAARAANFSNELGVDGTVRFLRNVMGLWLLQESVRAWEATGSSVDLVQLLKEAGALPGGRSVIDPDRPEFLAPNDVTSSDMPDRIRRECARVGHPVPETPAQLTRCILDSLAVTYQQVVSQAAELSGVEVRVVHLVGGGSRNELLCQLTADACQVPVVAGPVEAAAFGNILVQARANGVVTGTLPDLRRLVAASAATRTYRSAGMGRKR